MYERNDTAHHQSESLIHEKRVSFYAVEIAVSELRQSLARHHGLRLAFPVGSNLYVTRHPITGVLSGLSIDLGKELAARLETPIEYLPYDSINTLIAASSGDNWDLATIIIDPARCHLFNYTYPYIQADATYIVHSGSGIHSTLDVDNPKIRIGVSENSAFDLFLTRSNPEMNLIRFSNVAVALKSFEKGEIDAVAGPRHLLSLAQRRLSDSIVLEDRFDLVQVGMATLKDRPSSVTSFLNQFLADLVASGWITSALRRSDMLGVTVSRELRPDLSHGGAAP